MNEYTQNRKWASNQHHEMNIIKAFFFSQTHMCKGACDFFLFLSLSLVKSTWLAISMCQMLYRKYVRINSNSIGTNSNLSKLRISSIELRIKSVNIFLSILLHFVTLFKHIHTHFVCVRKWWNRICTQPAQIY